MESGNKSPQKPTLEERERWAQDYGDSLEAKRLGLTLEEYRRSKDIPINKELDKSSTQEGDTPSNMINYINRWEIDNKQESQLKLEQLSNFELNNNSSVLAASRTHFLSYLLRIVREQMTADPYYKQNHEILGELAAVYKIEINDVEGTNRLQFYVYANKIGRLKKHRQHFKFQLDSSGKIFLD